MLRKIINKFRKKKDVNVCSNDNIVEFPKKFIPSLLDHEPINNQTLHLTQYFRSSKDLEINLDDKEKQDKPEFTVINLDKTVNDKEERYNKFLDFIKNNSDEHGTILVTNNDIVVNLELTKKIVENLKIEGCNKGDLYVKNQKTYLKIHDESEDISNEVF
jgi:hypothetical protein